MQVAEIKDGMRRIEVQGKIVETPEPRTVTLKNGQEAKVAEFVLEDESGQIKLVLWDDAIQLVKKDDNVVVSNGYATSFRDEVRLNVGRYGTVKAV